MGTSITYSETVAASTTVYPLANTILDTAPAVGRLKCFGRHAAAAGTLKLSLNVAGELVADRITMAAAAGAPIVPDDFLFECKVVTGQKLLCKLEETGAANTATQLKFVFDELSPAELAAEVAALRR